MLASLLLLLADGRLPAGGHAHSGGLEQTAAAGLLRSVDDLALFLEGRLRTTGLTAASIAAAAVTGDAFALDAACDARTPSAAAREASRLQGRGLLRVAGAMVALPPLPARPHHAVALGAVVGAAGGSAGDAALVAAQHAVTSPATAAVRLLSFDPLAVHALLARLAPRVDEVASLAAQGLAATTSPLADLLAEQHVRREVRLFAS